MRTWLHFINQVSILVSNWNGLEYVYAYLVTFYKPGFNPSF